VAPTTHTPDPAKREGHSKMNVDKLLARWQGGRARLWDYTVSHKVLVIRVEEDGRRGNLHLYCGDVSSIHAPTEWAPAVFHVEDLDEGIVLRDAAANVEIRAGGIEVAENCKP
jgi:hypothetical protein